MLTYAEGKLRVSELFFEVPTDHSKPAGGFMQLFARSVTRHENPVTVLSGEEELKAQHKPWFVYLQVSRVGHSAISTTWSDPYS